SAPRPRSAPPPEDHEPRPPESARLFAPGNAGPGGSTRMAPVRVPAAPALPEPLALQRGLRPLQRYRAPVRPVPRTLDERATAELAAQTRLVLPVLRTDRRREARLLLLMDVSTSTVVWRQALDELRQVCARAGAFREVRLRYLHQTPDGRPGCSATAAPAGPLHAPEQLSDPTGRCVTLVLSDCAGPMWRSGRMQRLLHRWASTAPVAVVQPLPQRMWQRTHLPARRGTLHRREGPAGALEFLPERPTGRASAVPDALPVPVLALRRASVEGWARLVSGATGQSLTAAAGWVRAGHPRSEAPVRAAEDISGADRVRAFWRPASPEARRLAVYLSAVPLYLPVMQLVQHAMLAGSGPDVLSEVLLGGVLRRRPAADDDPDAIGYEFLPGVARELRTRLAVEDAELLFKHCSAYVERRFGRSARNFPALAGAFLRGSVTPGAGLAQGTAPDTEEPAALRAFAQVSAEVLRDLGARMPVVRVRPGLDAGALLALGTRALARYEEEGLPRELDSAVAYLRQAADAARTGEERTRAAEELALALLRRWRAGGVAEDLGDAWQAVGGLRAPGKRGTFVRGMICVQQAIEVAARGLEFPGVPDSLREWARTAAHGPYRPEDYARAVLLYLADRDLTEVLRDRRRSDDLARRENAALALLHLRDIIAVEGARLHGPEGPYPAADPEEWYAGQLHRALEAATSAMLAADDESLSAARGRLRLALARHHAGRGHLPSAFPDRRRSVDAALSALYDLRAAVREGSALPDAERCRVWLDAAEAEELFADGVHDGAGPPPWLDALHHALTAAGDDNDLVAECRIRTATALAGQHDRTGDPDTLDRAVGEWEAALTLLPQDDPRLPAVLDDFGTALSERGEATGSAADTSRAVELLRRATEETPPDDPRLLRRRAALGAAYLQRYDHQQVLSDLYEADWLFGEVARGADDAEFTALAHLNRGWVKTLLHERTGLFAQVRQAVDCFTRAVEHAREAGLDDAVTSALRGRGHARELLGRTAAALADYRQARNSTTDPYAAEQLDADIARLAPASPDESTDE
uniref:SAV_2336 N-terminal domain-related protein n=1 Tax=Streptomyces sp. CRN 30 TaxID=3075613 RepID=UPI002A7F9DD9